MCFLIVVHNNGKVFTVTAPYICSSSSFTSLESQVFQNVCWTKKENLILFDSRPKTSLTNYLFGMCRDDGPNCTHKHRCSLPGNFERHKLLQISSFLVAWSRCTHVKWEEKEFSVWAIVTLLFREVYGRTKHESIQGQWMTDNKSTVYIKSQVSHK